MSSPRSRRGVRTPVLAGLALACLTVAPAASARADDAVIAGQVRHGVEETGVAEVEVTLLVSEEGEPTALDQTTTDADGRFRFDRAPLDVELEVVADYADATTRSGPFVGTGEGNTDLELLVYDTTEDPADVRISSWVVWVDRELGVTFQHDLRVDNTGDRTWLGSDPDEDGTRTVLAVPLPAEAFGLGFLGRFTECCAAMRGDEYVHISPLPPGRTMGTVRYTVETTDRLELSTRLPVDVLTLMLPDGVGVTGAALERTGDIESRGTAYGVYSTAGWEPGQPLTIGLTGLEVGQTPWWWFAAAGLGGLIVIAAVAWRWRRNRSPTSSASDTSAPNAPAPAAATTALSSELLLEEVALLDLALERGFITTEVHHALRAARTSELRALRTPMGR
jgi:hypothetical protein